MTKLKHKPTRHAVKLLMTSKLRHGIGHPTFVKCLAKIKSHSTPIVRNRSRVTRKRRSYSGTKRVLLKIKKQVNNSCPANLEKWTALVSTHRDTILRNPLSSREIVAKDSDYELFSSADSNSNFESETENDEEPFYRSLNSSCQDISLNETYIGARNTASKNVVTEDDPNVATFSRALQSPEYRNEPDFQSDEGFHVQSQSSDEIKVQTTSNSEVSSGLSPTSHDSSTFGDPEKTIDNNSSSAKVNESDSKTINARSGIKQV